jgi:RimJ/RimL family protein N-acetyltransferase
MTSPAAALPLLGLRITAGPLELRGITDDLLGPLANLAVKGVHDPGLMPFSTPWTLAPAAELPRNMAQHYWLQRASWRTEKWSADLATFWHGELVGSQGLDTHDYLITRTGETMSWLSREFHGRGIGTAMRQVMCAFAFDYLDAESITSAAYADNPASLAVSRKVGYADNGRDRRSRMDQPVTLQRIVLSPENLVRFPDELTVEGLPEFRRSIGLDQAEAQAQAQAQASG